MTTSSLLLWLEAPLQSWGADSKFGRRDSLNFPTKSGVLGLVCCALGAQGEQRELLEEFSQLKQTIVSYVRKKGNTDIKADKEVLLRDFHMVGSGYDDKDPWRTLLIPKTSGGKRAVGGGAKLTYRYYLQDAHFAVILEISTEKASLLAHALMNPVYAIYLGRKNCIPTDFVFRGHYDTEEQALSAAQELAISKDLLEDFRVYDGDIDGGDSYTLNDVPIQFGQIKKYKDRRVSILS